MRRSVSVAEDNRKVERWRSKGSKRERQRITWRERKAEEGKWERERMNDSKEKQHRVPIYYIVVTFPVSFWAWVDPCRSSNRWTRKCYVAIWISHRLFHKKKTANSFIIETSHFSKSSLKWYFWLVLIIY